MFKVLLSNNIDSLYEILKPHKKAMVVQQVCDSTNLKIVRIDSTHDFRLLNLNQESVNIEAIPDTMIIGVPFFTLNVLGQILSVTRIKPKVCDNFWEAIEFLHSENGSSLSEFNKYTPTIELAINAFNATLNILSTIPPHDKEIIDISNIVTNAIETLTQIELEVPLLFKDTTPLIKRGMEWAENNKNKSKASLSSVCDSIVSRKSTEFVNHLCTVNNKSYDWCVTYNAKIKKIIISQNEYSIKSSSLKIAKLLWNNTSRGNSQVAVSPSNLDLEESDLTNAVDILSRYIDYELMCTEVPPKLNMNK